MASGIYTYRIEDGNFAEPPFKGTGFIITAPDGIDLPLPYESCNAARTFCNHKNGKIKEANKWRLLNSH